MSSLYKKTKHLVMDDALYEGQADALKNVKEELRDLPALVTQESIELLSKKLKNAYENKVFILQAGDCAETFDNNNVGYVQKQVEVINSVSHLISKKLSVPVIRVGRIAGQYAKPRSSLLEVKSGVTCLNYLGDSINKFQFCGKGRQPDPRLMIAAYQHSKKTLEYLKTIDPLLFTSHEALLLPYERMLTRKTKEGKCYNFATHYPWCGKRSMYVESPYIDYLASISNPVAIKVNHQMSTEFLREIIVRINPLNLPGRLTLIHRMGARRIEKHLGQLIQMVHANNLRVLWSCDAMHGNTITAPSGVKTRCVDDIFSEINSAFKIHHQHGSTLNGLHLEVTGALDRECINSRNNIVSECFSEYKSYVDPRLNRLQVIELMQMLGDSDIPLPKHAEDLG